MPEGTSNSIVNLGDVSKPANTLIKKISNAVGGLLAPWQLTRVAKAEAEAAIIKAQGEIQVTDLHRRAMHRFVEEEARNQKNIEDTTAKALPQLNDASNPNAIEDDWITNFFEKSRIISDGEMQNLWSRVLAGEANKPGSYSKRTVNFLSDLDKIDAELFSKLCGFAWMAGVLLPLVFDPQADIYTKQKIDFTALNHLESIGLIKFDGLVGFTRTKLPKHFTFQYYGRTLVFEMPKHSDNQIDIGKALFSKTGLELAPICGSKPVDGFWEYVSDHWKQHLLKSKTEQVSAPATKP